MIITYDGKKIKADDKYLKKLQTNLNLTLQQAIKVFLEEEGYITDNEEYNDLLKKGTAEMSTVKGKNTKGTKKGTPKPKDTDKEKLVQNIANKISDIGNVTITNSNNEIKLIVDGIEYKIKISKTRAKKT